MENLTNWEAAKNYVNKLSADYQKIIKDKLTANSSQVRVNKNIKTNAKAIDVYFGKIGGKYDLVLTVLEGQSDNKARYYLFSSFDSLVYIRDLLSI